MQEPIIDELFEQLRGSLPAGMEHLRRDFEKNLQAMLAQSLKRLNLVTREEFEVQRALLARSREKLALLEQRLQQLEQASKP